MKFIIWVINDIHMEFDDIHWEGCQHITRRRSIRKEPRLECQRMSRWLSGVCYGLRFGLQVNYMALI